jgi:hypothetical protein
VIIEVKSKFGAICCFSAFMSHESPAIRRGSGDSRPYTGLVTPAAWLLQWTHVGAQSTMATPVAWNVARTLRGEATTTAKNLVRSGKKGLT